MRIGLVLLFCDVFCIIIFMNEDILLELKNYFKKLQRIVLRDADFNFFNMSFFKKNKIDDMLCCIIATLPDIYKKNMRTDLGKKLSSVIAYNVLFDSIKRKCPFNSNLYIVEAEKANNCINTIINTIERDINYIEKNA